MRVPCSSCSCGPATPAPSPSLRLIAVGAGGVPSTAFPTRDWIAAFVDDRIEAAVPLERVAPHGVLLSRWMSPVEIGERRRSACPCTGSPARRRSEFRWLSPPDSAFGGDCPHTQRPGRSAAAAPPAGTPRIARGLSAAHAVVHRHLSDAYKPVRRVLSDAQTRTSCGERLSAPGSALRRCCRGTRGERYWPSLPAPRISAGCGGGE